MLVFESGHDGIVVWVTEKFLPRLELPPDWLMPANRAKQYLPFQTSPLGYRIFKRRQLMKEPLEELRLTTVIFNI